jgi:hypothetical protein
VSPRATVPGYAGLPTQLKKQAVMLRLLKIFMHWLLSVL